MNSDRPNLHLGSEPTSSPLEAQVIQQLDFPSSPNPRQKATGMSSNRKGFKFMRTSKPDSSTLLARPFLFGQKQQLTPKKLFSTRPPFAGILNSPQMFSESDSVDTQIHTPSERIPPLPAHRGSPSTCTTGVQFIHDNTIAMKGQARDDARMTVEKLFMDIEQNKQRCAELQSEVASLTASNLSTKRSHLQSTQELERLKSELLQIKAQLASSQQDIQSSQSIIRTTRAELVSVNTQLTSKCEELSTATAEIASMRAHNLKAVETLKATQDNYCTLQVAYKNMKTEHVISKELLVTAMKEVKELRFSVADGLSAIRPLIDEEGSYMRATQTRMVVQELQDAMAESQRVTDLLRDKLHHLSAQLAESQTKVRDLEEEKHSVWCKILNENEVQASKSQVLWVLENKVNDLAARLFKRETEIFDALSDTACLRTALDTAQQKLSETSNLLNEKTTLLEDALAAQTQSLEKLSACEATLSGQECELSILKAKNLALEESKADLRALAAEAKRTLSDKEIELKDKDVGPALKAEILATNEKLVVAENMRRETLASKCLQDEELVRLRCDMVRLEGDKLNLEQMLAQSSSITKEYQNQLIVSRKSQDEAVGKCDILQRELKESRIDAQLNDELIVKLRKQFDEVRTELIASTCKQSTISEKNIFLDSECSRLQKELESKKEELQQEQLRISVIQDRFDSQTATLRLAKEQSGDLQDRLASSQCSFASKLEATAGELRAEIAVLTERNNALTFSLDQLKQDSATQNAVFVGASVEFEQKLAKQESTSEQHIKAQEQRASTAELALKAVERELLHANDTICNLEKQLGDLGKVYEAATVANALSGESLELARLRTCLRAVEEEKRVLQERESHLMDRYQEGKLTNNEKDFVTYLIRATQSLHEEEMVAKDNELSMRQSTIKSLNTKISGVESTLARVLKEKGKEADPEARSMVDLRLWISSSPKQVLEDQTLEKSGIHTPSVGNAIASEQPTVSVTSLTANQLDASGKGPMTFARLAQDSDDEYAPSELSQLSSASRKRTLPSVVLEEPLRPKKRLRNSTAPKTAQSKPTPVQKKRVDVKTRQKRK